MSKSSSPLSILLVHEDPRDRARLTRLLRKQFGDRAHIREATSGRQALTELASAPCDVALIDAQLPDMFSVSMIDQVSRSPQPVATVLVVSRGGERLAAEAVKHGAVDFVFKEDLDADALQHVVDKALSAQEMRRANRQMAEQLQKTQSQMDHFLRAISHDMGANLMLLDSSFKQLRRTLPEDDTQREECLDHVEACLKETHRFLHDLAQLSATGNLSMEPAEVDLLQLVEEVLFEQRSLIAERGAQVQVQRPLPKLWCNPGRIRQVITNLLRNALKHGCDVLDPRVTISAFAPALAERREGFAWLAVHDNGRGIPAADRERIFLPGQRLPHTRGDGTGMGLAIVKRIVDHYGGQILVDPQATGTRLIFSLPMKSPS